MLPWIKKITFILIFLLCITSAAFCNPSPPKFNASGAILIDAKTGQVLFEKDADKQLPPASTTKIMTAILALESNRLEETTTISAKAANTAGSTMYLEKGQIITLHELLTGLMLRSGNDSAIAIAEFIAGSVDDFVVQMNEKAKELGAYHTQFQNPNGLPTPGHYSTAYDLAWITRYAMNNPIFAEIVNTKHTSVDWKDSRGNNHEQNLQNTNKLLWMLAEADGVKTGTTNEAGPCLVASATRQNQRLIAVILHDKARWQNSQKLLQWGFDNYELFEYANSGTFIDSVNVEGGFGDTVDAILSSDAITVVEEAKKDAITVDIDLPDKIKAPVYQGQKVGELRLLVNHQVAKKIDLIAQTSVEEKTLVRTIFNKLTELFRFFSNWGVF